MGGVTCRSARIALQEAANGQPIEQAEVWAELSARNALSGSRDQPVVTEVGQHVLVELKIRGYRCDEWPLGDLAAHEDRVLSELDTAAHNAEYFLTELGPVVPDAALPYLRIVSTGLANRRESPESLAERFRNVWGMLEVIEGDARDRLLAAEILLAGDVVMSEMYAPIVTTVEALRSLGARRAIACAALLHLEPVTGTRPQAAERWRAARQIVPNDEAAALLATVLGNPVQKPIFESIRAQFQGIQGMGGRLSSAVYLASQGVQANAPLERVLDTARRLGTLNPRPLLTAALLTSEHPLSPEELVDWVEKAATIAGKRQLAANPKEFHALGVALVEGLPRSTFQSPPATLSDGRADSPLAEAATLVALHAWVYRPLLDPTFDAQPPHPVETPLGP